MAQIYQSWMDMYGNTWKYDYYGEDPQTHLQTIKIVSVDFSDPDCLSYSGIPDSLDGYAVVALGPIFKDIPSLLDVTLPKTVIELDQTFQNSGLMNLENTEQVKTLQNGVFQNCNMDSISLPNCTSLGWDSNFRGCTNLKSAKLPKIQELTGNDFEGCTSLQSVELGNVTNIAGGAFEGCTSLQSVELGNVTSIGGNAFNGCSSLQSVELGNVTSIGGNAFNGCSSLQYVDLKNVTSIEEYAFNECTSLQNVDLNPNITNIGNQAFSNCPFLTKIKNIDFPNCTSIGDNVFIGLKNIKAVKLPQCKSIGQYAFSGCEQLKDISIPNIVSLGTYAFTGCQINQLTLPECIETLGYQNIPYIVINATNVPELSSRFEDNTVISVPNEALNAYKTADVWKENSNQIFAIGTQFDYDVKTTAQNNAPGLLQQLDRNSLNSVVTLKISGTINGYDIMLFRNKMDNLHHLDLSDADIVANPYEYYEGYCTKDSVLDNYSFSGLNKLISIKLPKSLKETNQAFNECKYLKSVVLPDNIQNLGFETFARCSNLENVEFKKCKAIGDHAFERSSIKQLTLPAGLESIGENAFKDCASLASITLSDGLKEIKMQAFENCRSLKSIAIPNGVETIEPRTFAECKSLKSISLPPSLKRIEETGILHCDSLESISLPGITYIGGSAFDGCFGLKEIKLPSTLEKIEAWAFNATGIEKVYAYTVLPININQNAFWNYGSTALYVPTQSVDNYYLNTQWSQFKEIHEFNEPYKYFYLDKEFTLEDKRFDGTPDIDIKEDGGLKVDGKDNQEAGDVTIKGDGDKGNSGTLITDGNLNAKKMRFDISVSENKWYFFSFPFDIKLSDTKAPGEYKWKMYDGSIRADQGSGGWVNLPDNEEWLKQGKGYIFQTNKAGTLTLKVTKEKFGQLDANNIMKELDVFPSGNNFDASWNFIGNPQTSYYNVNDLGYEAPITVWNGNSYEAVRPGDDDYTLHPFQAFFVQKPTASSTIEFKAEDRLTKTGSEIRAQETKARRLARGFVPSRMIINLNVSDGSLSDKTRVVFNDKKSRNYEMDCDAAKFMTLTQAPQLYSVEGKGTKFAINERPMGSVQLGFTAKKSGTFTISAVRMDQPMLLKDNVAGITIDLTNGDYEFTSEAGTFNKRFLLTPNSSVTSIADVVKKTGVNILPTEEGIQINGCNGKNVDVYNLNGAQVASSNSDGMLRLSAGVYIVKVNGMSTKVMVK